MGRMPEACKAAPQTGLGGQKFLAQVIAGSPSNGGEGHCTLTVMDPVLFVADKYGEQYVDLAPCPAPSLSFNSCAVSMASNPLHALPSSCGFVRAPDFLGGLAGN